MKPFHVNVHALPKGRFESQLVSIEGIDLRTLLVPSQLQSTAMSVSFEETFAILTALPRMHCELDGSFVWVSHAGGAAWQIDGNLYDRDGRLVRVDLKGSCPETELQQLLDAFRCNGSPLMFEFVRQAVFVDEGEFWRLTER